METQTISDRELAEKRIEAHNFSAGPAVLPRSVLLEVKEELPFYRDIGTSVLEISHRSPEYTAIEASARNLLKQLLDIGDEWHVLFLQGGASMQFYQVPVNFLAADRSADYLLTGSWASKAYREAAACGHARVAATSKEANFSYIPSRDAWDLDDRAAYLHYTSNNTIFGTQFHDDIDVGEIPVVCDASSDFLSRPLNMEKYDLIYAGAQKNLGPAGVTLVLIRDDFLQSALPNLPTILDYNTHVDNLFNTPPVFAVYMVEKCLKWLTNLGGLAAIRKVNERKAGKLYTVIDASTFYRGTADRESRSLMNVCFRLTDESLEQRFLQESGRRKLSGLKGHRSVGGMRASIYNACPEQSVDELIDFMKQFERENG